ncbi:AAA family ATPase [Vibrio maerlii]|uniref:AAA family ATPase n=1 Tax=Vibrio maerlii TaxID=2231648 RepID=UPI000E3DFCF8|nr:type II secretion system protein Z [Vibrio maerlii]
MIELADILGSKEKKATTTQGVNSVLFYQTNQCKALVKEAYQFEGYATPSFLVNMDSTIKEHVRDQSIEIVMIELNESEDVVKDAERISSLLPNDASVIVIGREDSISTIRNLKKMGFYYLFWPINKQELIDFVSGVYDNRSGNKGLGQKRKAKQISLVGSKGGVGTTMLCSELAHFLTKQKHSSCVVVDNAYQGGNLDIMMGIEKFKKKEIRSGELATSLDTTSAHSLLYRCDDLLSVLSIDSPDYGSFDVKDYTQAVVEYVGEDANFLIEDLSASSASLVFTARDIVDVSDAIVLIITPTVSAVREAASLLKRIRELQNKEDSQRILLVFNNVLPESNATITKEEAEKYLLQPIDVVVPHIKKLDAKILTGKRATDVSGKAKRSIHALGELILGEEPKHGFFRFGSR